MNEIKRKTKIISLKEVIGENHILRVWFNKRFNTTNPEAEKPSYFAEWVQRWRSGRITSYMDSESKRIWHTLSHS